MPRHDGATIAATAGASGRIARAFAERALIFLAAFAVAGLLLLLFGINPFRIYAEIWRGAFGSVDGLAETLIYATPILLTALAAIICFRCGMWNIGADGQLYLGAIAATAFGLNGFGLPAPILIPLLMVAAFAGGAAWGAVPGYLRIRFGANEVIVTIMMNFLAVILATHLIGGSWASGVSSVSRQIVPAADLPILVSGTRLHANLVVALVMAVAVSALLRHTVFGYQMRAVGQNPRAARVAGISIERVGLLSFVLAGGVAGLAGFGEVTGIHHSLPDRLSPGFGYTGIAGALLAGLDPRWAIVSSILLAALNVGAQSMQRATGVPQSLVGVIEGIIVLSLLAFGALRRPAVAPT